MKLTHRRLTVSGVGVTLATIVLFTCGDGSGGTARTTAPATGSPNQRSLGSAAIWTLSVTPEFHDQLEGWLLLPSEDVIIARGSQEGIVFDEDASTPDTIQFREAREADPGELLSFAPDGSHYGTMSFEGPGVARFVLRARNGAPIWSHRLRGHYYYKVGPGARITIGHSADSEHPGKPGTNGELAIYDSLGSLIGRYPCRPTATTRFDRHATLVLVRCRSHKLALIDRTGAELTSIRGNYRDIDMSEDGSLFTAVRVAEPRTLRLERMDRATGAWRTTRVHFSEPISVLQIAPESDVVIVAGRDSVHGIEAVTGNRLWRHRVGGSSPEVVSMSVDSGGFLAIGVRLASEGDANRSSHPAAVEVLRRDSLLGRVDFDVRGTVAGSPGVELSRSTGKLIVMDYETVWLLDLFRLSTGPTSPSHGPGGP